jgi:hypothetical protein
MSAATKPSRRRENNSLAVATSAAARRTPQTRASRRLRGNARTDLTAVVARCHVELARRLAAEERCTLQRACDGHGALRDRAAGRRPTAARHHHRRGPCLPDRAQRLALLPPRRRPDRPDGGPRSGLSRGARNCLQELSAVANATRLPRGVRHVPPPPCTESCGVAGNFVLRR